MTALEVFQQVHRTGSEALAMLSDWLIEAESVMDNLPNTSVWDETVDTIDAIVVLFKSQIAEFDPESRLDVAHLKAVIYTVCRLHDASVLRNPIDYNDPEMSNRVKRLFAALGKI